MINFSYFIFFTHTTTTEIYTLSLHDALPISTDRGHDDPPAQPQDALPVYPPRQKVCRFPGPVCRQGQDRKSTRLNSSHTVISYAVFCLKKKKKKIKLYI